MLQMSESHNGCATELQRAKSEPERDRIGVERPRRRSLRLNSQESSRPAPQTDATRSRSTKEPRGNPPQNPTTLPQILSTPATSTPCLSQVRGDTDFKSSRQSDFPRCCALKISLSSTPSLLCTLRLIGSLEKGANFTRESPPRHSLHLDAVEGCPSLAAALLGPSTSRGCDVTSQRAA